MANENKGEFGPEFLVVFIGYSEDGEGAAQIIHDLEADVQAQLDKFRRINPAIPFHRVKFWKWNADAPASAGGQARNINPTLERADVAVFVFNERVGRVAWEELEFSKSRRPQIPVLPFFPSSPPSNARMMLEDVSEAWADLLKKRKALSSGWTDPETNALTPLPQYKDVRDLRRLAYERLELEIIRLTSAYIKGPDDDDKTDEQLAASTSIFLGQGGEGKKREGKSENGPGVRERDGHVLSVVSTAPASYEATFATTLRRYRGPCLVVDPTGEIYRTTSKDREKVGPVVKLDPWSVVTDTRADGLNPIDILDAVGTSAIDGAHFLANLMVPYRDYYVRRQDRNKSDPFWPNMQRKLAVGLFLLAKSESKNNEGVLSRIRDMLNGDDTVYNFAVKLDTKGKDMDPIAYQELASFLQLPDVTRGGIIAGLNQHFSAFSSRVAQRSAETTTFDVNDWLEGRPMTIYVVGPLPGIDAFDIVYRLWLSVLFHSIPLLPDGRGNGALIILDIGESFEEWPGLRSAFSRGKNCRIWVQVANAADLNAILGNDATYIIDSCSVIQALRPNNRKAASALGELIGVTADDILGMGTDDIIVTQDGGKPQIIRRLDR